MNLKLKTARILYIVLLTLLSSCGSSTDTDDNLPTDARDYMYAGNPGTEIVMTSTHSETDTSGRSHTPQIFTNVMTIMERDALHPKGGKSIRIRHEGRTQNSNPRVSDSLYYSYFDNSIVSFNSVRDTVFRLLAKNPLTVGTQWVVGRLNVTVKSVGEIVNTTYKPLKAVLVVGADTSVSSSGQQKTISTYKLYYAPEVFFARGEYRSETIYSDNKKSVETQIDDLVQYTKK